MQFNTFSDLEMQPKQKFSTKQGNEKEETPRRLHGQCDFGDFCEAFVTFCSRSCRSHS